MTVRPLSILTQNAWGGAPLWRQRRERLARAIAETAPDVVGLQEIHAPTADVSDDRSQAHELAQLAGDYDAAFAPGRVTASGHCEGVALLVRRGAVVLERSVLALSRDEGDALDRPHQRVVLRGVLRRDDVVIDAMVTHLSLSKRARARTLVELCAFAAKERPASASAVLMGDFNATPEEPALGTLAAAGWIDAWEHVHPDARGGTWPAGAAFRRIDYIWAQTAPGWRVEACERTPVSGSDHVGLLVRLQAQPAASTGDP